MYNRLREEAPKIDLTHYEEAIAFFASSEDLPEIRADFYPYVNGNHTIRIRNGRVIVRVSDTFQDAPSEIHRSLAHILVGKLLNKPIPDRFTKSFEDFVSNREHREKLLRNRSTRGRKKLTSPTGARFDLTELFHRLNSAYFDSTLEMPDLGWSEKRTFRRLGHYDEAHQTIVISRSLDGPGVPEYVVAFVLYHEMLHMVHEPVFRGCRRYSHTKGFRQDEAEFEFYDEAELWIEKNAGNLRKYAKRGY